MLGGLVGVAVGSAMTRGCHCNDPGMAGGMIGFPVGAVIGAVVAVKLAR
jgi:tetrahydromethanopterin S-methyltransferase subunit C